MKRLFVVSILLLSLVGLKAQDATEKWNDIYKRYEYYDSRGNLTGYRKWNSLYNRWDYFDNNSSKGRKYEYKSPYNLELIERALTIKQQEYNRKLANIQALSQKVDNEISLFMDELEQGDFVLNNNELERIERHYKFVQNLTSYDVGEKYDKLSAYFNDAYIQVRNWRIQARKK